MATAPPPAAQVILPSIGTGTVLPHPLATPRLLSLNDAGLHRSCFPPLLLDDKKLLLPLATPRLLPLDDAGLRRSCLRPLLLDDKKLMLLPLFVQHVGR